MKKRILNTIKTLLVCGVLLGTTIPAFSAGWTPTDAGFVVNFEKNDQFLLSVWIDLDKDGEEDTGEEFFVCDYPTYNGGRFKYEAKNYMKLVPQVAGATKPSAASVWTVGDKVTRIISKKDYSLGGICYTMWGNSGNTLVTQEGNAFKFLGDLTDDKSHNNLCDVVIVVPSDNKATKSMDPNNTLKRGGKFNGRMGIGFAGMVYREVYLFDIPRANEPSYTNASLVTFNTTSSNASWSAGTIKPGMAAYAYADEKHNKTTRTVFRLYVLGEKAFSSCNSYYFGWNVQDYKKYRSSHTNFNDSTSARKIYALDHFECMEHETEPDSSFFKTRGIKIPEYDSLYYYVGYRNTYHTAADMGSGTPQSKSVFKPIDSLRIRALRDEATLYNPPRNAFGFMAIDSMSSKDNLGVAFEPMGYMLRTNTGRNVAMYPDANRTIWTCEEMWYIPEGYMDLSIKATLWTGPEFSDADPGADIKGWSVMMRGDSVPVAGKPTETAAGKSGWAQINVTNGTKNGGIVFVEADTTMCIKYHNNGFIGLEVPSGYPKIGDNKVKVENARLKEGFTFLGWATSADGPVVYFPKDSVGKEHKIGDIVTFAKADTLHLYAKATYDGNYRVAFSFMQGGKRYWLTHPNTSAPRFTRARTFDDWTDVYQGMSDAENSEPNYISTYKMIVNPVCALCDANEVVLDPQHETVRGVVDSLTFYENWTPSTDEFIGLYYDKNPNTDEYINTVLANNTWAGAFQSTKGWPAYNRTAVDSTKLYSTHYFTGMDVGEYSKHWRAYPDTSTDDPTDSIALPAYVKYESGQFNGVAEGEATEFQITGIAVVDAHYVILPDTTDATTPWRNEIVFDYHEEAQYEQVWSKLIGKQLMACLRVGPDTVYFHPNRDKTFNSANALSLSGDYRLTHAFEYIHDARPDTAISAGDSVMIEETENAFCCNIVSGAKSPKDVRAGGSYIDIVDTLRVWLRPSRTSKIKEYYGRWKKQGEDDGLTVMADGSRYRDILVKTKTYHYSAVLTKYELVPQLARYSFNPTGGNGQDLNFTLRRIRYKQLLDKSGAKIREEVMGRDTLTTGFTMISEHCSFTKGTSFTKEVAAQHVHISTKNSNEGADNLEDVLVITQVRVGEATVELSTPLRVPLVQTTFAGDELIWSAVHPTNGKRYFIIARGDGNFEFREFTQRGSILYQRDSWTHLRKGAETGANTNTRYITPWKFTYSGAYSNQLYLKTEYGVNKHLHLVDGTPGSLELCADSTAVTYEYVAVYTHDNGNEEELVRLKMGADKWLKFKGDRIELTTTKDSATTFSWGYLQQEYNLQNNGAYPSIQELVFDYGSGAGKSVKTPFKAFREYSMLLNNQLTYLCREEETGYGNLSAGGKDWKTSLSTGLITDARTFDAAASSGLGISTTNFTTTVTPASATSPKDVKIGGKYVDIVDTLRVTLSTERTDYRFTNWSGVSSISDAALKIPLVRKTYHDARYDSIMCMVENDEHNFAFPSSYREDSLHTFTLNTYRFEGINVLDVGNKVVSYTPTDTTDLTEEMHLESTALAEIRLVDEYGKVPDWCEISAKGTNTITVRCKKDGVRTPRSAYLYFAYIVTVGGQFKYVNFKLTVSQASLFQYANNQTLIHSQGASGDPLMPDGRQQVHENKRILYYYNPAPYGEADQNVELPIRERAFYGWWRWYQENKGVEDTDIPDSVWMSPPRNVGKYNYPFRIIGDSVSDGKGGKKLVTMGRYTVFHYPAWEYKSKVDPPSKSPQVMAPWNKDTVTYVADIGNYYDNMPLSMAHVNQIDTAVLDTMLNIIEPTLSLREVFELHPWTEMAEKLEHYKDTIARGRNLKYMESHEVMAPTGNRLLLRTEQRYRYNNLAKKGHSESLLGYYMHDDNWATWGGDKDTMIWCGGWDVDCKWYTYDPHASAGSEYTECNHPVTEEDDFLDVPAKNGITSGNEFDTVYYCLRARSQSTTVDGTGKETTAPGLYWFNICRYMVIYHDPRMYGPYQERGTGSAAKAIITNDEIEQNYEVLERLNFDYIKPGKDYHVYPHPLPWADASYGYSYPVSPAVPDNRYHNDFAPNFPGTGEYGIINRIPYSNYWHKMEQHGGAENGYMIYCDGMSTAGQVAALSLNTQLCEGQKMYFSGFVGNPSNQSGKSNPNFTFSVQGSKDGVAWTDITSYMTGDIQPSDKWSQIFFPINQEGTFDQFRIRIYNVASDFDGNDFIIDDMCVFATKPPLIAYQANTKCMTDGKNDSITHVVLRVDYQGFVDTAYNKHDVYYTVEKIEGDKHSFIPMEDGYINGTTIPAVDKSNPDTIYGKILMPSRNYVPMSEDSIFTNLKQLEDTFARSNDAFRKGYLYENLDGVIRPVLYVIHRAKMTADNTYKVRMSLSYRDLLDSKCAMTSNLKVTNKMMLEINGEEMAQKEVTDMCANTTYDLSVRVKETLYKDSIAPIDLNGSCVNDWLLYGDTSDATSVTRYGYNYTDIKHVISILRDENESNSNRFAANLAAVNRNVMKRIQGVEPFTTPEHTTDHPYDVLAHLVNNGFLTLYQSKLTATVMKNDSVQYVIFPIVGTASEAMYNANMDVCPAPMFIKLHATKGGNVPMKVGGIYRDSTQTNLPVVVLATARTANDEIKLHIDSIMPTVALHSITLLSTDDPNYYEGVHLLNLEPDKVYNFGGDNSGYYTHGSDMYLRPSTSNNYQMRQGYSYTFGIVMQTLTGSLDLPAAEGSCAVGTVPFTVSVVPDYLRWSPKSATSNNWNDPENWIGVDDKNVPLHEHAHFAPLASTDVIIPAMPDTLPYPVMPETIESGDSVRQVGFVYNICDDIRFLAGAAIAQQQRLTCDVAVVDMNIPQTTWALRAAPVTGMISGDLFMANADLSGETRPWSAGVFDANGRSSSTGNASFWLSVYSRTTEYVVSDAADTTRSAAAEWSRVTNGMTLSLPPAQGWAVYTRTVSNDDAVIRLPKSDDIYYYYDKYGEKLYDLYEDNLRARRNTNAGEGGAGKLAFRPDGTSQTYTITNDNDVTTTSFVFGNPTMGYIDIWGFITDNTATLKDEMDYLDNGGYHTAVTKETALASTDTIINLQRYLPPMHAIVVKLKGAAANALTVTLNANRIVTHPNQRDRGGVGAPSRFNRASSGRSLAQGIMTVTAVNPVSPRCVSRLLIGQGYRDEVREGEDAMLTTLNIDKFHMTNTPTTPFNIYAQEGACGLSIDLRNEVLNVPVSFYMSDLPYDPTTSLWFTGVNNIDGELVFYDAFTDSERAIIDGICLDIETPEQNHETRYFIRRKGFKPSGGNDPIATGFTPESQQPTAESQKLIVNGHVLIIRNGQVYTMFGQKIR